MNSKQLLNTKNLVPVSSKVSVAAFYAYCLQKGLPVAIYKLPGTGAVNIVAQKTTGIKKLALNKVTVDAKGFIFAPFTESNDSYRILIAAEVTGTADKLPALNFATGPANKSKPSSKAHLKETGKRAYKKLVSKIVEQITDKKFGKVVAARVVKAKKPADFDPVKSFTDLCQKYPHAFVSLVHTPTFGTWMGASPEILLQVKGQTFTTYALAGTKANTKQLAKEPWGEKEAEEQAIVTRYITKSLTKADVGGIKVKGPETIAAGNLLHLRSTITYQSKKPGEWQRAVKALHPTPAVAGLPRQKAIDFIVKNEKAPRSFYCGYLGPVNLNNQTNLFVNLRCMQVLKNRLAVYVGCGITGSSNPELEWRESKIKSETLLSVVNP